MALVDHIKISASAGRGGDGVVRWLHMKGKEFGGPSGGDGGNGGDIVFRAVRDLQILNSYRGRSVFRAKNGEHGGHKEMAGKNGEDAVLDVPVGSLITRKGTGESFELLEEGQTRIALKGGRGGAGNAHFKSSTNQYPEEAIPGKDGEKDSFDIELKIIADIGIVGLPNAGKSSLLNSLTRANAKVGAYAFTTLEPNLGVLYGHILADIPGLIEGASEGKGLGHEFLRHIARTRALIHCVATDAADPLKDYARVRDELTQYSDELSRKPEIVFLTKADLISSDRLDELVKAFSKKEVQTLAVSVIDDARIKEAGDTISRFLQTH